MARKLKFGSPAWRKKYMKTKRKPSKRNNTARRRPAKRKRASVRRNSFFVPKRAARMPRRHWSAKEQKWVTGSKRKPAAKKSNPPKMKRLNKSTGWMKASAVKIVKKGGQMQVLVRKPGRQKAR